MTEDAQSLARRVQEQTVNSARGFFGASLGRLKDQLRGDRFQLEDLAEQLRHEETRARIRGLIDSYSAIEGSIDQVARDLGLESPTSEQASRARETGEQGGQRAQGTVGQAVRGAQESVAGAAARAAGAVGQVAENLPGGQLLGRTTDESGRTVQRVVDESGNIMETTLDESGELLDENPVGSLADLPTQKESTTEEGHTLRTVEDVSGALVRLEIGEDGNILDVEVPPDTE